MRSIKSIATAAAALVLFGLQGASAAVVYNISSTGVTNCTNAPHGLWTNGMQLPTSGNCNQYYDIAPGTVFTFNNPGASSGWTGSITGTAVNPSNVTATINLQLTDFRDDLSGTGQTCKQEGGAPYDPATMDFFLNMDGIISIDGTDYAVDSIAGGHAFQWGIGANAKSPTEFGGSVWLNMAGVTSGHWDLNLVFGAPTENDNIPEPGMLALFGLGLAAVGFTARRKRTA